MVISPCKVSISDEAVVNSAFLAVVNAVVCIEASPLNFKLVISVVLSIVVVVDGAS